ncbi:MAG: DUF2752 domain-containing protein [Bacteroidales bacterium]|nr:DUF2752 domain-containing protein [Bacteroidales bacterium]
MKSSRFINEPYHIINVIFAGIIILIFIYSGIFSAEKNNHPVKSACIKITGKPCISTGLSRSFSEIVRFRFESAKKYNQYGLLIFFFFLSQLFLRFFSSFILIRKTISLKTLILTDSIVSVILYIICFFNFLKFW